MTLTPICTCLRLRYQEIHLSPVVFIFRLCLQLILHLIKQQWKKTPTKSADVAYMSVAPKTENIRMKCHMKLNFLGNLHWQPEALKLNESHGS